MAVEKEPIVPTGYPAILGSISDPIGPRLYKFRLLLNIRRKELADRMNCHHLDVRYIERRTTVSLETVYKIVALLDITLPQLLGEEKFTMYGSPSNPAGAAIKAMREARGRLVPEFSKKAGFSLRHYQKIEQSIEIPERFYLRIKEALSKNLEDITDARRSTGEPWVFPPKGHIGSKLRHIRESKGLNKKQMAKKMGYTISIVNQMEKSETIKKTLLTTAATALRSTLQEIVDALDAEAIELFGSVEMPIGKQFKAVRLHFTLTPREMARKIKMHPQNYFDIEEKMVQCTGKMLSRVAVGLGVTNEYVLEFRPKESPHEVYSHPMDNS
ncbi:MAG: hypothetical protein P4L51_28275 [Puia sp.]|nr:hypothetical protein [Puia sp.]